MIKESWIILPLALLTACSSQQIATASKYQSQVLNACAIASASASDPAAILLAQSVPDVARAISLVNASCSTEAAIANLVNSPLSVSWLGTLVAAIESGGTVVPPPPATPASVVVGS